MKKKTKQIIFLFSFIVLSLLTGYLGSQLTGVSIPETYLNISDKPSFFPPTWIFAPVWSILYTLMGISAYLLWRLKEKQKVNKLLILFFAQLFVNLIWPIIFFGLGQYLWAFIDIIILLIMIIVMVLSFEKISKLSAYLLLPYLFWVGFASILNLAIVFNR
ncbi:MAG TPA: tryptophan-rich sensory protein [Candidatus Pacearchaeota archaeon]|nr:tryptophan-rich sensory protein [Candidatus Pacearchaeota archaeon]HPR79967.1 tryptophan-rich sensory protein [Candidatus Pacearchaeota archaeon]